MRRLHLVILALFLGFMTITLSAQEKTLATYFRVWQGFRKPTLAPLEFMQALPSFMEDTVLLYQGRGLSEYLVAIAPSQHPTFVPDEFALVAIDQEATYRSIRNTPEGRQYSERHWDVFNKENSKSAPLIVFNLRSEPWPSLEHNVAYDMFNQPLDWSEGHQTFNLFLRNESYDAERFLEEMADYAALVAKKYAQFGLRGFIFVANRDYYAAYMNWRDEASFLAAENSQDSLEIHKQEKIMFIPIMQKTSQAYDADSVQAGAFIRNNF